MNLDEWGREEFDEWEIEAYDVFQQPEPYPQQNQSFSNYQPPNQSFSNYQQPNQPPAFNNYPQPQVFNGPSSFGSCPNQNFAGGPFPEVEIGSSSDEDAPPLPESSKLARENLELKNRVNQLIQQSKNVENNNISLKKQLKKCRNIFKSQIKSMKKAFS